MLRITCYVLILVILIQTDVYAQSEDNPFLYYYSFQQEAFIVERVDGSDSRILAGYTLPEQHIVAADGIGIIDGDGWSASGKWFAWTSRTTAGAGGLQNAFLVNREGSRRTLFSDEVFQINMRWSPSEDLLLLSSISDWEEEGLQDITIYDATTDEILLESTWKGIAGNAARPIERVNWSPNGKYIALSDSQMAKVITADGTEIFSTSIKPTSYSIFCDFGALP